MSKKGKRRAAGACLRLDPEKRLCPKFDATSVAKFQVSDKDDVGVRVVDDCAEEHIM